MFQIDHSGQKTALSQIVNGFKGLIEVGILQAEEHVPAIGSLSKELICNPATTRRAYLELESQGYLTVEQGQWYVSPRGGEGDRGVGGLYGRIHADLQELIRRGEDMGDIRRHLGMSEAVYIEIDNLTKRFDSVTALDGFSMGVKKSSIYGLIGPNGSGKTTALKHLAGILQPDSGCIRIGGTALTEVHSAATGYMPDDMYFLPGYDVKGLEKFFRSRHKKSWNGKRYENLLDLFGFDKDAAQERKISTFSPGIQKQLGFALAISAMPDVLLLDETLDGLDPAARKIVLSQVIEDVSDREMTVIITSHNMREIDGICDTVGVIRKGRMAIQRNLDDMKADVHKIRVAFGKETLAKSYPYDGLDVLNVDELGNMDLLVVRGKEEEIAAHISKFEPVIFESMALSLDEIFAYDGEGENHEPIN